MKWNIARFNTVDNALSGLIDDFWRIPSRNFELNPSVDITEDEHAFHVKAELPGMDEKDLTVTLHEGMLTIAGEKKKELSEAGAEKNFLHCERVFGSFSRSVALPEGVDPEGVTARYANGVLEVDLKKSESVKPRKIDIAVN
jgi:HSP20 family protein